MSQIDDLMAQLPLDQIAARLGVDRTQAEAATRNALPALLGGLHANAQDPAGEASLTGALAQHDGSLLGSDLDAVDVGDGSKIVGNIFGGQTDQVVSRLSAVSGADGHEGPAVVQQLLPLLAPYVMAYLAKRLGVGGGLGGILGNILGGATAGSSTSGSGSSGAPGGVLGDILGGLLGGGRRA
ncbi:DUF937 domain-containing protein [Dermatophilaceae bacterium Soc4.6]